MILLNKNCFILFIGIAWKTFCLKATLNAGIESVIGPYLGFSELNAQLTTGRYFSVIGNVLSRFNGTFLLKVKRLPRLHFYTI